MTPAELQQIVTAAGHTCRIHRDTEVVLETCVFCGNTRSNLELSAALGVYHCWACRSGGRLEKLLRDLTGQTFQIAVAPRSATKAVPKAPQPSLDFQSAAVADVWSAAHYLARRGVTQDMIRQYGIVVCTDPQHRLNTRIAIPAKDFWTGEVLGWMGRSYTNARPKYLSTLPERRITGWRVRNRTAPAVVVEGAFDGMVVHQAGFHAAVLGGVGAQGIQEWAARLAPDTVVVLMLDGSALIQAQRLYWQMLPMRSAGVGIVALPEDRDPASLTVGEARELVQATVRRVSGTSSVGI